MDYVKQMTVKEAHSMGVSYKLTIEECNSSYRGRGIYVIDFGNGIKIGRAQNIVNRIRVYKEPWCRKIVKEAYFKCANEGSLETFLKRRFRPFVKTKGSTEFFTGVRFETIIDFIQDNKYFEST